MSKFICSTCGISEIIDFSVFPSNPNYSWHREWDESLQQILYFCSEECKTIYYECEDEDLYFFNEEDFDEWDDLFGI